MRHKVHPVTHIGLAVGVAERLQRMGVYLGDNSIREGLEKVSWRGRLQIATREKEFLFDSAHNPDAMAALSASVREVTGEDFLCVIGILSDKKMEDMMPYIRKLTSEVVCVSPKTIRARPAEQIKESARRHHLAGTVAGNVGEGMDFAAHEQTDRKIVVTGSIRTVGEAMEWWYAKHGEKLWT